MSAPRNARAEAQRWLADGQVAVVLEPSPPARTEPPFFADDPVDPGTTDGEVVSPLPGADRSWSDLAAGDAELAEFACDRWLGPYKPLAPVSPAHATTRHALHRLATHVVYLTRRAANGKYGLRWTLGGFGTPFFGDDEQVRVSGASLVHQRADRFDVAPITTLAAAAAFVGRAIDSGFDHGFADVVDPGEPDEPLAVDPVAALAIGDWFGFAWSVLEEIRAAAADASRPQLWPEHFDAAIDVATGEPAGERRANIGFSPGDGSHPEPYCYVGPWTDDRPGDDGYWNAAFGAVLGLDEIVAASEGSRQRQRALAFINEGLDRLRGAGPT